MAKKKTTQVAKTPQEQQIPMDDVAEKQLENLKDLNTKLINEAVERRKLVDLLIQSKGSLESALTRSESEKLELSTELTQLLDRMSMVELEKGVVSDFVVQQKEGFRREKAESEGKLRSLEREMKELMREKGEFEKVLSERDRLVGELGVRVEEMNGLKGKIIETEERERTILGEVENLRNECTVLVKEKEERKREIEDVIREKGLIEKSLGESNGAIVKLKKEIEVIGKEKRKIEELRKDEGEEKIEMEKRLLKMNGDFLILQGEEKKLTIVVADLERRERERTEREEGMGKEIDALMNEKEEKGKLIEGLIVEKDVVVKSLSEALEKIDEQKQKLDAIVGEKIEMEEAKRVVEDKLVELQREIGECRVVISSLEAKNGDLAETNKGLGVEIDGSRGEIKRVTSERDDARKEFEEEREISVSLREKVLELEKKVEETEMALTKIKTENRFVLEEKRELEGKCGVFLSKVASLEGNLLKDNEEIDGLRAKLRSSDANLGLVLKMLKGVRDGNVCVNGEDLGDEIKPCLDELEAIKSGIKERESKVEEMKNQVELLNSSVEEAHKKKSFWAVVSSATTIFAAASVAYIARGH